MRKGKCFTSAHDGTGIKKKDSILHKVKIMPKLILRMPMKTYRIFSIRSRSRLVAAYNSIGELNTKKKRSFDAAFKLRVVEYAEEDTNRGAGRKFKEL